MPLGSHEIFVLNGLVEATIDSLDGYTEAAKDARNHLRDRFLKRASERLRVLQELQAQVLALGGEPADDGTVLASAHRIFMHLRSLMKDDDKVIVEEVDRAERHVAAQFEAALADKELSVTSREIIQRSYARMRLGLDEINQLKEAHDLAS